MQDSPERQALEEALRDEPVGSPKIQALADYAMLKDIEWRTEQRPAEIDELDDIQLIIEKTVLEQHIRYRKFHADAYAYIEALKNAEAIVQPYVALDTPYRNPYQIFLDDLREINREKSREE
jgi:hypothetical protein